jgi:hypothetical protein
MSGMPIVRAVYPNAQTMARDDADALNHDHNRTESELEGD